MASKRKHLDFVMKYAEDLMQTPFAERNKRPRVATSTAPSISASDRNRAGPSEDVEMADEDDVVEDSILVPRTTKGKRKDHPGTVLSPEPTTSNKDSGSRRERSGTTSRKVKRTKMAAKQTSPPKRGTDLSGKTFVMEELVHEEDVPGTVGEVRLSSDFASKPDTNWSK